MDMVMENNEQELFELNTTQVENLHKSIKQRKNFFCSNIEQLVKEQKLSYIESVIYYCNLHDLPVEYVPQLINDNIRDNLYLEGMNLNLLKKVNQVFL